MVHAAVQLEVPDSDHLNPAADEWRDTRRTSFELAGVSFVLQRSAPACLPACRYIPTDSASGTPKCYQPAPTDPRAKEVSKAPDHMSMLFIGTGNLWIIRIPHLWSCEAAARQQQRSGAMQRTQCLIGKPLGADMRCNSSLQARSFTRVQACARCAVEGEAYCAECACGYTFSRFVTVLIVHPMSSPLCMATAICASCPQHVATPSHGVSQVQTMSCQLPLTASLQS